MSAIINPGVLEVPKFDPDHIVVMDYETFWEKGYTLDSLTTSEYVLDPRFEAHGCAIKINGGESQWFDESEFRLWSKSWPWEKTAVVAQHAHFEALISSMHYVFAPGLWIDTLSMSRGLGLPGSLEHQATHFKLGVKGKDALHSSKGKHRKDFTSLEWARLCEYACNDVDLEWGVCQAMLDGFPESELFVIDATVRMFSEPQLVLNEPMLREHLKEVQIQKTAFLERVGLTKKDVGSSEKLAAALKTLGIEAPKKISKKTGKEGYAFAKTDAGMQELLEHEDERVRWLAEARISVKSTQTETRGERYLWLGANGRPLPVYLKWFGAHTGRWTASDGTQFQNLEKTNKKNPKKGMIKKSLCAIPGRKVVAADSGAIEARGTAWLADHKELIEGFKLNRDVYSDFASIVYGRPIDRKKNPEDEIPGFLGKIAILGLGYGMGWAKLSTTLLAGAMGGPPVTLTEKDADTLGVNVDAFLSDKRKANALGKIISRLPIDKLLVHCACAEKIVQTYRKANKPIKDLWKLMESVLDVMDQAGDNEQFTFGPNDCLTIVHHGIIMPNGLQLRYPGLRKQQRPVEEDDDWVRFNWSYEGAHGKRAYTYGGAMVENVIQGLARIVISDQMLSLKAKYGYEPVLLTHDEEATIVEEDQAAIAEYRLVEEMKVTPKWAQGWPLNAEGGHGQSYGEA